LLRLQIDRRVFAAPINFKFEVQPVAFIKGAHPGPLDRTDVNESVGLSVITLNEAEAFHRIEELDRSARLFARQLALRGAIAAAAAKTTAVATLTRSRRWPVIGDRKRLTLDLEIRGRHLAAAIDQREFQWLSFGQASKARLFHGADMHENIFAAIITDDEAEALLAVEELYNALAFANDLGRHAAATTAAAAKTTAAAAAAAEAAASAATAKAATVTTAAAAKTAAITETAPVAAETAAKAATALIRISAVTLVAETVALVLAAPGAASSIKTHALLITFASSAFKWIC
jgi:hypothetical protein